MASQKFPVPTNAHDHKPENRNGSKKIRLCRADNAKLFWQAASQGAMTFKRIGTLILCVCLTLSVAGCGDGFTNGGVPDGRSVVTGRVVRADSPYAPISQATVTITTTPRGSNVLIYRVITGANGDFSINGIQVSPINSNVTVLVEPNDTALQKQQFNFLLTNNRPISTIIALPPTSINLGSVAKVDLTSQNGGAKGVVKITASVLDTSGNPLDIVPTMIFDGSVGNINADGTFTVSGLSTTISTVSDITATIDVGPTIPPKASIPVTVGPTSAVNTSDLKSLSHR